jgi:hypothetical protein
MPAKDPFEHNFEERPRGRSHWTADRACNIEYSVFKGQGAGQEGDPLGDGRDGAAAGRPRAKDAPAIASSVRSARTSFNDEMKRQRPSQRSSATTCWMASAGSSRWIWSSRTWTTSHRQRSRGACPRCGRSWSAAEPPGAAEQRGRQAGCGGLAVEVDQRTRPALAPLREKIARRHQIREVINHEFSRNPRRSNNRRKPSAWRGASSRSS